MPISSKNPEALARTQARVDTVSTVLPEPLSLGRLPAIIPSQTTQKKKDSKRQKREAVQKLAGTAQDINFDDSDASELLVIFRGWTKFFQSYRKVFQREQEAHPGQTPRIIVLKCVNAKVFDYFRRLQKADARKKLRIHKRQVRFNRMIYSKQMDLEAKKMKEKQKELEEKKEQEEDQKSDETSGGPEPEAPGGPEPEAPKTKALIPKTKLLTDSYTGLHIPTDRAVIIGTLKEGEMEEDYKGPIMDLALLHTMIVEEKKEVDPILQLPWTDHVKLHVKTWGEELEKEDAEDKEDEKTLKEKFQFTDDQICTNYFITEDDIKKGKVVDVYIKQWFSFLSEPSTHFNFTSSLCMITCLSTDVRELEREELAKTRNEDGTKKRIKVHYTKVMKPPSLWWPQSATETLWIDIYYGVIHVFPEFKTSVPLEKEFMPFSKVDKPTKRDERAFKKMIEAAPPIAAIDTDKKEDAEPPRDAEKDEVTLKEEAVSTSLTKINPGSHFNVLIEACKEGKNDIFTNCLRSASTSVDSEFRTRSMIRVDTTISSKGQYALCPFVATEHALSMYALYACTMVHTQRQEAKTYRSLPEAEWTDDMKKAMVNTTDQTDPKHLNLLYTIGDWLDLMYKKQVQPKKFVHPFAEPLIVCVYQNIADFSEETQAIFKEFHDKIVIPGWRKQYDEMIERNAKKQNMTLDEYTELRKTAKMEVGLKKERLDKARQARIDQWVKEDEELKALLKEKEAKMKEREAQDPVAAAQEAKEEHAKAVASIAITTDVMVDPSDLPADGVKEPFKEVVASSITSLYDEKNYEETVDPKKEKTIDLDEGKLKDLAGDEMLTPEEEELLKDSDREPEMPTVLATEAHLFQICPAEPHVFMQYEFGMSLPDPSKSRDMGRWHQMLVILKDYGKRWCIPHIDFPYDMKAKEEDIRFTEQWFSLPYDLGKPFLTQEQVAFYKAQNRPVPRLVLHFAVVDKDARIDDTKSKLYSDEPDSSDEDEKDEQVPVLRSRKSVKDYQKEKRKKEALEKREKQTPLLEEITKDRGEMRGELKDGYRRVIRFYFDDGRMI